MKYSWSDGFSRVEPREGTEQELCEFIKTHTWSPAAFKSEKRNTENFLSTELIVLDVDEGATLEQAREIFKPYKHIIATTRNHQKEKNGVICDRYRVILFLAAPITDIRQFAATWNNVAEKFPFIDKQAKDPARLFYSSKELVSINDGELIQPVEGLQLKMPQGYSRVTIKGRLGRATLEFLAEGAPKGQWNLALYKAARDLHQNGYSYEEAEEKLLRVTGHLDKHDYSSLQSAYKKEPSFEPRPENLTGWVNQWLAFNQVSLKYNGTAFISGTQTHSGALVDQMYLDARDTHKKYSLQDLSIAFSKYEDTCKKEIVRRYMDAIQYNENTKGTEELKRFVRAVEGQENRLTEEVIRHFIWQVKRKMKGLRVEYETMPIFYGKQGGGKTRAIRYLVSPIKEIILPDAKLSIVNDDREAFIFMKYFIVIFDEMARAKYADIECIKNIITSETISYRKLSTHLRPTGQNVSTFIGSTNKPVDELIQDSTGMRRFYQVNTQDKLDWETINTIDYISIWQSINDDTSAPIVVVQEQLSTAQEEIRTRTSFEEWLEHKCIAGEGKARLHEAYKNYSDFMESQRRRGQLSLNQFAKELKKGGLWDRDSRSVYYKLTLKPDFDYKGEAI